VQVVYSEPRARLLRLSLRAVQVLAGAMALLALYVLIRSPADAQQSRGTALLYAVVLLLQGAVLVMVARRGLRQLPHRGTDARLWCLTTAGLTLLSALPVLTTLLGIAAVFVGLFVLTTALRRDGEP